MAGAAPNLQMIEHKFEIGQMVYFRPTTSGAGYAFLYRAYQIIQRLLAVDDSALHYRIRRQDEQQERTAGEKDLQLATESWAEHLGWV